MRQLDQRTWNYSKTSYSSFALRKWQNWDTEPTYCSIVENFLNVAGNNWSSIAPKFAVAQNKSVNYTAGKTPYEIVFGTKPQTPMSLKLGFYRNKHKLCCSNFCKDLPPHYHSKNSLKNELLDHLFQSQLSQALIERERTFKQIYSSTFERCREQTV